MSYDREAQKRRAFGRNLSRLNRASAMIDNAAKAIKRGHMTPEDINTLEVIMRGVARLAGEACEPERWQVIVSHYARPDQLIRGIKTLREFNPKLGLKEAKDWVQEMASAPVSPALLMFETTDNNSAQTACGLLREAGFNATVTSPSPMVALATATDW